MKFFLLLSFLILPVFNFPGHAQQELENILQTPPKKPLVPEKKTILDGDWAGWIYLKNAGNQPFRMHFDRVGENLRSAMDFPALNSYRLPVSTLTIAKDKLKIEAKGPRGNLILAHGIYKENSISGEFLVRGKAYGNFQLQRSPLPIANIEPKDYAHLAGSYRLTDKRILVIAPNSWGELTLLDSSSGRHATLFPKKTENHFFIGPAIYVPGPVLAEISFKLEKKDKNDKNNNPLTLLWQEKEKEAVKGTQVELSEEELKISHGKIKLAGTLVKPSGDGPFPAAVIVAAESWKTRRHYRYHASLYASSGVAAFIYDQQGYGNSSGVRSIRFGESANDVVAIVKHLVARPDIIDHGVGVSAVSRGGWIAPLVASRSKLVSFLILLVSPAMSPSRLKTSVLLNMMRKMDKKGGQKKKDTIGLLARMVNQRRPGSYTLDKTLTGSGPWQSKPKHPAAQQLMEKTRWYQLNKDFDPLPALNRVKVPVLALFAEKDMQVVPDQNLPIMEAAFKKAKNRDYTLSILEGVNHELRLVPTAETRLHRQVGFAPLNWSIVLGWLKARVVVK